jgi:hypothetical protein
MGVCISKATDSVTSTRDRPGTLDAPEVLSDVFLPHSEINLAVTSEEWNRECIDVSNSSSTSALRSGSSRLQLASEEVINDLRSHPEGDYLHQKLLESNLKIIDLESEIAQLKKKIAPSPTRDAIEVETAAMNQEILSMQINKESQAALQSACNEILTNSSRSVYHLDTISSQRPFTKASPHLDFDEDAEDDELMKSLFDIIGSETGCITKQCIERARSELTLGYLSTQPSSEDWERLAAALETKLLSSHGGKGIDFNTFKQVAVAEIPKMPGRVHWACSLNLGNTLAKHLKPGTIFDGQRGIKEMAEADVIAACAEFAKLVPSIVVAAWRGLREGKALSAEDANSKFAMTEGAFAGKFATLDDFYRGVEHKLGQPNPKLHEGMLKEHCARPNAGTLFLAPNYGLCTTPRWEWQWTVAGADLESPYADLRERLAAMGGKYPGEEGDRCSQSTIRFSVEACGDGASLLSDSDGVRSAAAGLEAVAEALNSALLEDLASDAAGMLDSAEQRLRGVVVVEPAAVRGGSVVMAVTLPMPRAAFSEARNDLLRRAVSRVGGVAEERVRVEEVTERVWVYCKFTSEGRLREALERTPLESLGWFMLAQHSRLGLGPEAAESCEALAAAALRCAPSASLTAREWCAGFDAEAQGVRDLVQTLVDAYEEQTAAWAALGWHRRQGRTRDGTVELLMARPDIEPVVERARLRKEEFAALRLYTGPLYMLYNALMRDFPPRVVEGLAGNRYETTMFVIISGITKLAKVTPVPPKRLLYRGLGGMLLPEQFWKRTAQGFLGGVELGLMSTTADRSIAIQYSGHEKRRAMMLEIQAGRIDVGGSLGFLSQYAGEEEFLMQPLSCLEVTGRPRMDRTERGEVLVVPTRVNVNLKSVTVEELTERRKILHLAMAKNLREELSYEAADNVDRFLSRAALRAKGVAEVMSGVVAVDPDSCTAQLKSGGMVGFPYMLISSGRAYFEVEVLEADKRAQLFVGAAGSNFSREAGKAHGPQARLGWGSAVSWGVYSIPAEEDLASFRLHDFDLDRDGIPSPWGGVFAAGDVLGVACDADRGVLAVSRNGSFAPPFGDAFTEGVRPGPAVGAGVFFAFGGEKATLRYNTGADPVGRPLRFAPPGRGLPEQVAAGFTTVADASAVGLDAAALVLLFQAAYAGHEALDAADFNEDQRYKELVNEVLDLKVRLLNKQRAVIALCEEGAGPAQVRRCADAPCTDFGGGALEVECPYRWRDVFSGYFLHKPLVEVPLGLAPAQVALVWEAVMAAGEAVKEVKLGAEVLPARSLLHTLSLTGAHLQYAKYGAAVAGLAIAGLGLTNVDLRGHEFDPLATQRLIDAVANTVSITAINGCCLTSMADGALQANVRQAIAAGCSLSVPVFQDVKFGNGADLATCVSRIATQSKPQAPRADKILGTWLNRAGWAFVLARVQALEWLALDLKEQKLGRVGATALAKCVAQMTSLRTLDLRESQLDATCAAAIAGQLSALGALRSLDLRENHFGGVGWDAALEGISRSARPPMLSLARSLARSLAHLCSLTHWFLLPPSLPIPRPGATRTNARSQRSCAEHKP